MTRLFHLRAAALVTAAFATFVVAAACGGSGRRPVAVPGATPSTSVSAPSASVQDLFEAGRYAEVLSVSAGTNEPAALWFAAHSSLRLGQRDQAAQQFARLRDAGGSPSWQAAADLALALLEDDPGAIDRARGAAAAFASDPFVQFQLGLAHARRGDLSAAAQAFDRCIEVDPRFAYAYYHAGLAYDRLNRTDLAITRFEMFQRLAPNAPERPEVASILQTVRSR